jgi:hypothetical protein
VADQQDAIYGGTGRKHERWKYRKREASAKWQQTEPARLSRESLFAGSKPRGHQEIGCSEERFAANRGHRVLSAAVLWAVFRCRFLCDRTRSSGFWAAGGRCGRPEAVYRASLRNRGLNRSSLPISLERPCLRSFATLTWYIECYFDLIHMLLELLSFADLVWCEREEVHESIAWNSFVHEIDSADQSWPIKDTGAAVALPHICFDNRYVSRPL